MDEHQRQIVALRVVNGVFDGRARPGQAVTFPSRAGFVRNEHSVAREKPHSWARHASAQQDRGGLEPVAGEEMSKHTLMLCRGETQRDGGAHSDTSLASADSTRAR